MTDENIGEMREEILVMKEWADEKVKENASNGETVNNGNSVQNNIVQTTQKNVSVDQSLSNQSLPKAGIKNVISILLILIIISAIV